MRLELKVENPTCTQWVVYFENNLWNFIEEDKWGFKIFERDDIRLSIPREDRFFSDAENTILVKQLCNLEHKEPWQIYWEITGKTHNIDARHPELEMTVYELLFWLEAVTSGWETPIEKKICTLAKRFLLYYFGAAK